MRKWEYYRLSMKNLWQQIEERSSIKTSVFMKNDLAEEFHKERDSLFIEILNELGDEGWELVGTSPVRSFKRISAHGTNFDFYFKRMIDLNEKA